MGHHGSSMFILLFAGKKTEAKEAATPQKGEVVFLMFADCGF